MNFGALNGQGGERRLNVLITRARRKCEVFTNLTHDDIDTTRTSAQGVAALKAFLKYAQTGVADVPDGGTGEIDSPFEEEVARALRTNGHEVVHQVGSGGFRIDLAIRDPVKPGRFLLGIECDGATYHGSRSARDRDRLRQQVLEGLGWSIHRIWSTDWFREPQRELRRVLQAIEQAKIRISRDPPVFTRSSTSASAESASTALVSRKPADSTAGPVVPRVVESVERSEITLEGAPYQLAGLRISLNGMQLHEVPSHRIAEWVERIADVQGPVHLDDLARQVALAAGVQRVGNRIGAAVQRGIGHARRNGTIRRSGDFVWHANTGAPVVRDRSGLEVTSRKIDRVAPEEIAVAIQTVVRASHGIDLAELTVAVSRMFGLQRTTEETAAVIRRVAMNLQREGALTIENEHVRLGR